MSDSENFAELHGYFLQGITLRMLEDLADSDLHAMACLGWEKLNKGFYQEARNVFYVLVYVDHCNVDYLLTLGLCYQKLNDHHAAILAFSQAGSRAITDPRPPFLAAQSYRALNDRIHEKIALESVLKLINQQVIWHELRVQAVEQLSRCPQ